MSGWQLALLVALGLLTAAVAGAVAYRHRRGPSLPPPSEEGEEPLVPGVLPHWEDDEEESGPKP